MIENTLEETVRAHRDQMLLSTDWWCISDRTPTQAQLDYRQALRDLTKQEGFPHNVVWPDRP